MDHYQLDSIFQALADPTRRDVLARLGSGPASVGELAEPFAMALPSFIKHIHVLEDSGLIVTSKTGRVRTCTISTAGLSIAQDWLDDQRRLWEQRTDRLEKFVTDNQAKEDTP